jgi:hypothetical protein
MEEDRQKRRGRRKMASPIPDRVQEYDFFLMRDVKAGGGVVPGEEPEKKDPANKSLVFFLE